MSLAEETEMSASEIDEFLASRESGVLSLAKDGEPYSIPISYGYHQADRVLYLRLVSNDESEKRQYLATSPDARLVVYGAADGKSVYRSVVATGQLDEVDPDSLSVEDIRQYGDSKRPLFEIWGDAKADLDIQLFRLVPEDLSGRRTRVER